MLLSSRFHQCMWENVFCFPETRAASASVKHHERDQLAPQKITYHTFCTNGSKLVSYTTFYCFHNLAYFDQICCSNYVLFKRRLDDQRRAWCLYLVWHANTHGLLETWPFLSVWTLRYIQREGGSCTSWRRDILLWTLSYFHPRALRLHTHVSFASGVNAPLGSGNLGQFPEQNSLPLICMVYNCLSVDFPQIFGSVFL